MSVQKAYPYILIIGGLIGLLASFILTNDTIAFIKDPNVNLLCNINPFLSCTASVDKWQNEVFGFLNSLLGIISFSMLVAIGVMLASGGRSKKPLWLLVNLGTLAAMIFVIWFFTQSVYVLGTLCLYCMIVWSVTWPIFLYTTVWNYREDHFISHPQTPPLQQRRGLLVLQSFLHPVSKYHAQILLVGYIIPILLIVWRFKEFFLAR